MRLTVEKTKQCFVPGDPDGAFVNIKALNLDQIARIESKCSDTSMDEDGKYKASVDGFKRANLIAQAAITGWGGFFTVQGEELKFNSKNLREAAKLGIMMEDNPKPVRFYEWVEREHDKFLEEVEAELVEASKN